MTDLLRPIEILRPQRLEFGAGLVGTVVVSMLLPVFTLQDMIK